MSARRAMRVAVVSLATLLSVPVSRALGAQAPADTALDRKTREVASELRCPVCQGNTIQDSPSGLAQEMKGVVREQLAGGKSPNEVKQYFVAKYGEWILLEPEARGFNLLVYALPLLAVAGGGVVIWRAVRKWTTVGEGGE